MGLHKTTDEIYCRFQGYLVVSEHMADMLNSLVRNTVRECEFRHNQKTGVISRETGIDYFDLVPKVLEYSSRDQIEWLLDSGVSKKEITTLLDDGVANMKRAINIFYKINFTNNVRDAIDSRIRESVSDKASRQTNPLMKDWEILHELADERAREIMSRRPESRVEWLLWNEGPENELITDVFGISPDEKMPEP